ncbi:MULTISPECIES: hypothetical protein [Staphylococcus]|uniref:hypothetical protein n=1 Tax=Staphylococcus TaxID=1279 RepID=UPI0009BEE982|nr:hypothetical protein [Staphylococcus xylosus]ARD75543.1 hypothetical protein AWC37_10560 [Staphylococcus xylosus]
MDYFMPPSLYFKLLKANFKDKIEINDNYKHLDLIEEDGLLEKTNILHTGVQTHENMTIFGKPYAGKYRLTTKGKKWFLQSTLNIGYALCTLIGALIGWLLTLLF